MCIIFWIYNIKLFDFRPQDGKKKKKGKLRKEDISLPTNFQHISHVGWDPNKGFDLENVDPKLKQFFSKAGVSERELQVRLSNTWKLISKLDFDIFNFIFFEKSSKNLPFFSTIC